MSEIVVLAKVKVDPLDIPNLKDYQAKNVKALKAEVPGFKSLTIWQSVAVTQDHLIAIVYDDDASADLGFNVSMEHGPLVASLRNTKVTPEVRRGETVYQAGRQFSDVPVGAHASFSFRVAEPGRWEDLNQELGEIFDNLAAINGYLGSFTCRNEALEEEVMGVVFWSNRFSFEESLPAKYFYEVTLYKRTI